MLTLTNLVSVWQKREDKNSHLIFSLQIVRLQTAFALKDDSTLFTQLDFCDVWYMFKENHDLIVHTSSLLMMKLLWQLEWIERTLITKGADASL